MDASTAYRRRWSTLGVLSICLLVIGRPGHDVDGVRVRARGGVPGGRIRGHTTRQVGGAFGVAVLGSILSSAYADLVTIG